MCLFWHNGNMKLKLLILSIIGVVIIGTGIVILSNKNKSENNQLQQQGSIEITDISNTITENQSERIPSQFACVGEYCDGHMSGDDYVEKYTVIKVPLVRDGGNVGCGAEIFFAPHTVPKTTAVLDATYKLLFNIKSVPEIPADGFRNTVGAYTKLFYDRVVLENGIAKVYLTGDMYGPGHCAEPELKTQMIQAALQYPTVNRVEIFLNGKVYDWCAMDVSDGEGPCPEVPQLWIGQK